MQDRLEKRIPPEFLGQRDRDGPTPDDVTRLTLMRVAPPPCPQIADDHQVGPVGLALPAPVLDHPHKRLRRQPRPPQLRLGVRTVSGFAARGRLVGCASEGFLTGLPLGVLVGLQPEPVRFGIEHILERDP